MNKNQFIKPTIMGVALIISCVLVSGCVSSNSKGNRTGKDKCDVSVTFKYETPEYKIENHKNLQKFTKRKFANEHRLGGQTRFSGLSWSVKNVKRGCGTEKQVTVRHRSPIRVIMPEKSSMLSCNYKAILDHELEHVAIYRDTPKEYEKRFIDVVKKGKNIDGNFSAIAREISVEMKRRNDKFHDKHGAVFILKNRCTASFNQAYNF